MTVIGWKITESDSFHASEDRIIEAIIYIPGTTQAEIDAATAIPENITGWSLTWQLRKSRSSPVALSKTTDDDITLSDPTGGTLEIAVFRGDTEGLVPGIWWHMLARTDPGQYLEHGSDTFVLLHPVIE